MTACRAPGSSVALLASIQQLYNPCSGGAHSTPSWPCGTSGGANTPIAYCTGAIWYPQEAVSYPRSSWPHPKCDAAAECNHFPVSACAATSCRWWDRAQGRLSATGRLHTVIPSWAHPKIYYLVQNTRLPVSAAATAVAAVIRHRLQECSKRRARSKERLLAPMVQPAPASDTGTLAAVAGHCKRPQLLLALGLLTFYNCS